MKMETRAILFQKGSRNIASMMKTRKRMKKNRLESVREKNEHFELVCHCTVPLCIIKQALSRSPKFLLFEILLKFFDQSKKIYRQIPLKVQPFILITLRPRTIGNFLMVAIYIDKKNMERSEEENRQGYEQAVTTATNPRCIVYPYGGF